LKKREGHNDWSLVKVLPWSLHSATRRARKRRERKGRVAPVGMTELGKSQSEDES
jgi:hypothetical protein